MHLICPPARAHVVSLHLPSIIPPFQQLFGEAVPNLLQSQLGIQASHRHPICVAFAGTVPDIVIER
jgi:hypothetical protein